MPNNNSNNGGLWLEYYIDIDDDIFEPSLQPPFIKIKDVSRRNPVRGCFLSVHNNNDVEEVIRIFSILGIEFSDEDICAIRHVIENNLACPSEPDDICIGVNMTDEFIITCPSFIGRKRGTIFLSKERVLYPDMSSSHWYEASTYAVAKEFLRQATEVGYKKADEAPWIDENGDIPYPYGDKTCYNVGLGMVSCISDISFNNRSLAHEYLFNMSGRLDKWHVPEGYLDSQELEAGKQYLIYNKNNLTVGQPEILDFDGNSDNPQGVIDSCGDYHRRSICVHPYRYYLVFKGVTEEHIERCELGLRERDDIERARLEAERVRAEEEAAQARYNEDNDVDTYNRDVRTQLISPSLHKMLLKSLDNNISKKLRNLNRLGYMKESTRNVTIRHSDQKMTYMPAGKDTEMTDEGTWISKGRQEGKYGKIIRKILLENVPDFEFTDSELEDLVNHIKAEAGDGAFKIVSGDDILYWYSDDNYADCDEIDTGTLQHSCMRDPSCNSFMELYSCNPDVCKLVILIKDEKLVGRALLWENKWMDRIYASDSNIKAFKAFAKEKGYHYKYNQNSDPTEVWVDPETGLTYGENIVIDLQTEFEYYPYADTMCYIDVKGGQISNDYLSLNKYCEMRDTGGCLEGNVLIWDEYNEADIPEEDAVYIEDHGYSTHYDSAMVCDIDGNHHLIDEMVQTWDGLNVYEDHVQWVDAEYTYARPEDIYECEFDGREYIEGCSPSVYLEELNITVMENNVSDAYSEAGYHYHSDDCWRSEEWLKDKGFVLIDGEWVESPEINV